MNKLFTRIGVAFAGIAMAIGVGVAVGQSPRAVERVDAATTGEISHTSVTGWTSSQAEQTGTYGGFTFATSSGLHGAESLRIYKSQTFTLTSSVGKMTSVTLTCTVEGTAKYGPGCLTGTGYTAGESYTGTWTGNADSFTLTASSNQARIASINITYSSGAVVSGVSITGTTSVTSGTKGLASTQLTATVTYSSGSGAGEVTWSSATTSVAVVSSSGLVTFKDNGSSVITATSKDDTNKKATVTVTASNLEDAKGTADNPFTPSEIRSFIDGAYDGTSTEYVYGIVSKKDAWNTDFSNGNFYLTENGNDDSSKSVEIFRYNNKTNFDALAVGDYVVVSGVWTKYGQTYETTQGNSAVDMTTVSKISSISATAITSSFPKGTVVEASNFTVNATYANSYVASGVNGFTFTVNGEAGAALNKGDNAVVITYLTKTANLNITGTVTHASSVSVDETASVYVGLTTQLTATVLPAGQSDPIVWKSADDETATVDQNGLVAGVKSGETTITVFADADEDGVKDAGEISDSCTLIVNDRVPSSLSITKKTDSFSSGDSFTIGNGAEIKVTFQDDTENPVAIEETDAHLTYYIGTQTAVNNRTADTIAIGDTLTGAHDGLYVKAYYGSIGATAYKISVFEAVDYSKGAYYQVTEAPSNWNGDYILVTSNGYAFNGQDANDGYASGTIDDTNKRIEYVSGMATLRLTKHATESTYSVQIVGGSNNIQKYISGTSGSNKINFNDEESYASITLNNDKTIDLVSNTSKFWFNIANSRFRFYKSTTTLGTDYYKPLIYKWVSNADKVQEFIDNNMHMSYDEGGSHGSTGGDGSCKSQGWYTTAKTAYGKLTAAQKSLFNSDATYATAKARLVDWAIANGETFDPSQGTFANVQGAFIPGYVGENDNSVITTFIVVIAAVSTLAIGGFFFLRKRKIG